MKMKLILVKYGKSLESFEVFKDIDDAFRFCKDVKNVERIDLVDVDKNEIKQGILSDTY